MESIKEKDPFADSFATVHEWKLAMQGRLDKGIELGDTNFLQSQSGDEIAIVGFPGSKNYLLSRHDNDVRLIMETKDGITAVVEAKRILGLN